MSTLTLILPAVRDLHSKPGELHIYRHIDEYQAAQGAVVTIGTFDGVHRGHRKILDRVKKIAEDKQLTSILLTFFPHPRMVLGQEKNLDLIQTITERTEMICGYGIDHVVQHPFSREFAQTTAEDYVKNMLVSSLNAKEIVLGYDHRFGRDREADISDMAAFAKAYNFHLTTISKQEVEAVTVSSTEIRNAIKNGAMVKAKQLLGHPFTLTGTVIRGKALGKKLGYPTANLQISEAYKIVPANGVYITTAELDGKKVVGMTNIGTNPTVEKGDRKHIETFFLDYDNNLYDRVIRINFHKRLRDEQEFGSTGELVEAMKKDEKQTREYVF